MSLKDDRKILILGVDGFDASLAKKFLSQGKMPNLQKFVKRGACRDDLVMLGGMPTVTPPMWTTLATGAYPNTHGITAFYNQHPEKLDTVIYALDSRLCKAEQLWNVFAEAGKKTLVWHWPGSSWPPTSDSPNLHVVDGTQPACVNMGTGVIDWEKIGTASEEFSEVKYRARDAKDTGMAGCVITDLGDTVAKEDEGVNYADSVIQSAKETTLLVMGPEDTEVNVMGNIAYDLINSPIKGAEGWLNAPNNAKEFTMITSSGFTKRPCLILQNESGIYDKVAIYKSKKAEAPLAIIEKGVLYTNLLDDINVDGELKLANRSFKIIELAEDGSYIRYFLSAAMDVNDNQVWHPQSLLNEIKENVGYVQPGCALTGSNPEFVEKIYLPIWDKYCEWQAASLKYFVENNKYDVIFSHLHNIDNVGHQLWHFGKYRECWNNDEDFYQGAIEYTYKQTDRYLGNFVKFLDEGWTIIITSDHGLMTEENEPPILTEGTVNVPVMKELGYTVLKQDENGNELRELDWTKTRAVAVRGGHIYINLKGRDATGIVEPEEKYELEAQVISDLYNYRDKKTGKRVVSIALRNKDARIIGLGGPECGDIVFFMEEYNIIHMDSLSTQCGYKDTSVSPLFIAAGSGIKENMKTDRVIRQVDVAPTVAVLGGVRMPDQCEGAPVYQILK